MSLERFHPAVRDWFGEQFKEPTDAQREGWSAISRGQHTLIAAPTGTGKTLAAFLCAIDALVKRAEDGRLQNQVSVLYLSPLKALSNDIDKNLQLPLRGIERKLQERGVLMPPIQTAVRTGDTTQQERGKIVRNPPHILVSTPESLYILLTSESGRKLLKNVETVIVDEIHAITGSKRGSHLALSLERLDALCERKVVRIGLSATQRPIENVANFLIGAPVTQPDESKSAQTPCAIVNIGHRRKMDLNIELPSEPVGGVLSNKAWADYTEKMAALVRQHRTTLIFVNTRRLAERMAMRLTEVLGEEQVTSHHGSLSKRHRLDAEQRLKTGQLKALVATSSLELGIDIGDIDLVCQIGSPHSIAALLQRVGRAGHSVGALPKGRVFPTSRDDMVECVAMLDCIQRGELDIVEQPQAPLDILAQQIVAIVASDAWSETDLFALIKRAWPYRELKHDDFQALLRMLSAGYTTKRGRRGAMIHWDSVQGIVHGRRGARLTAITCGGAIPDQFDYEVRLQPEGIRVGTLNEDFAIESLAGDIFILGNNSYRVAKLQGTVMHVHDAHGQPPTIPFWLGEAPGRTNEVSAAVSQLRERVYQKQHDPEALIQELCAELSISRSVIEQIVEYLVAGCRVLGAMPTQSRIVLERFFDETGSMHLVVHAPFGSRINRAWGLALRKRFCRSFNIELQAAASEDHILLSLGPSHSFPTADVFDFLHPNSVRDVLVQALLDAPMFEARWRWNATRALAIQRFRSGKPVAPQLQRMYAQDLLTLCFPDQVACAENLVGERQIPDHPLIAQTIDDCLNEAMDIKSFEVVLGKIRSDEVEKIARDTIEPSPFCAEIIGAQPYAYLDDAPLEERRTQVLRTNNASADAAHYLGALDPDLVRQVVAQAWPTPRDAEEMHDTLLIHGYVTAQEAEESQWQAWLETLSEQRRASCAEYGAARFWIAAERASMVQIALPNIALHPHVETPAAFANETWTTESALTELLRGRMEALGPRTVDSLATELDVAVERVDASLRDLEAQGFVFQGHYTSAQGPIEWCERRLLSRIHRQTIEGLRQQTKPVPVAAYTRFAAQWQHATQAERLRGPEAVAAVLDQLQGFEAPIAAWESDILPSRIHDYDPQWLDALCLRGEFGWVRRTAPESKTGRRTSLIRSAPLCFVRRQEMNTWLSLAEAPEQKLHDHDERVLRVLKESGACFTDEIITRSKLLPAEVENSLRNLVALGRINCDSFQGLRSLLSSGSKKRGHSLSTKPTYVGRWSAVTRNYEARNEKTDELIAWTLLKRWGIVFRQVYDRETRLPQWWRIIRALYRLEARGQIRGGRFVESVGGEQFALPEAVGTLRRIAKSETNDESLSLSAVDPLNLSSLATGERITAHAKNRVLYENGIPVAIKDGRNTHFLSPEHQTWQKEQLLKQRQVPPAVRSYLGNNV